MPHSHRGVDGIVCRAFLFSRNNCLLYLVLYLAVTIRWELAVMAISCVLQLIHERRHARRLQPISNTTLDGRCYLTQTGPNVG